MTVFIRFGFPQPFCRMCQSGFTYGKPLLSLAELFVSRQGGCEIVRLRLQSFDFRPDRLIGFHSLPRRFNRRTLPGKRGFQFLRAKLFNLFHQLFRRVVYGHFHLGLADLSLNAADEFADLFNIVMSKENGIQHFLLGNFLAACFYH